MSGEISDRLSRYFALLGIVGGEPWLAPPVTAAQIDAVQRLLKVDLPTDLVELLKVHNGGSLFDALQWLGCSTDPNQGLAATTTWFNTDMTDELRAIGSLNVVDPGPRTLFVAAAPQRGIHYDLDDHVGAMLYSDVICDVAMVPLSRDLASLMDCYLGLAESGFITVGENGPMVGPNSPYWSQDIVDGVRTVCIDHGVAPVTYQSIDSWLSRPEATSFSIWS